MGNRPHRTFAEMTRTLEWLRKFLAEHPRIGTRRIADEHWVAFGERPADRSVIRWCGMVGAERYGGHCWVMPAGEGECQDDGAKTRGPPKLGTGSPAAQEKRRKVEWLRDAMGDREWSTHELRELHLHTFGKTVSGTTLSKWMHSAEAELIFRPEAGLKERYRWKRGPASVGQLS